MSTLTQPPGPVISQEKGLLMPVWQSWFQQLWQFVTTGTWSGVQTFSNGIVLPRVTVAHLPAGSAGLLYIVTDANSPTYLAPVTGGGGTVTPVMYNGTAWVAV